jgi:hypothetical protein
VRGRGGLRASLASSPRRDAAAMRRDHRIVPVADMIIALVDAAAEVRLTTDNWGVFFNVYGIDTAPKETFTKIDKSGAGKVDRDQILGALHEYFYSSDPAAPGNWFYGTPPA